MLISIDQKPDITLNLLRDDHYLDLFTCLNYLEENQCLMFDLESFFLQESRFNNYLELTNQEVINNINNNFRINFLKEFVFPTFLSDKQLDELTTFLTLHNNTIICHIDSIMNEKMNNLHIKIEESPQQSLDFFTELFCVFRSSFNDLKNNFSKNFINNKLYENILKTLIKNIPLRQHNPSETRFVTIIQVCNEIIGFLCRNYQKAIIKVFKFKASDKHFYEFLLEWISASSDDFVHQILDLFRIQPSAKNESIDDDCLDFFIDDLVDFLAASVKRIVREQQILQKIKFVDFVIELFILFFGFQSKRLNDVLINHNFLDEISPIYSITKHKLKSVRYLKYLKEIICNYYEERLQRFDFKKVLTNFYSFFNSIPNGKDNMLRSLSLVIVKQIQGHQNTKFLECFVEIINSNNTSIPKNEYLEEILLLNHQTSSESIKNSSLKEFSDKKSKSSSKKILDSFLYQENSKTFEKEISNSLQKQPNSMVFEEPNAVPEKSKKPILSVAVSDEKDEENDKKNKQFKLSTLYTDPVLKKRDFID